MTHAGKYTKKIQLSITPEMYQFVKLIAERSSTSVNDVIRQAIREHLDVQEDIITSRSRMGRTVMNELEKTHNQLLAEMRHISKLLLAAVIVLMTRQGMQPSEAAEQITNFAGRPGVGRMLDATRKQT